MTSQILIAFDIAMPFIAAGAVLASLRLAIRAERGNHGAAQNDAGRPAANVGAALTAKPAPARDPHRALRA